MAFRARSHLQKPTLAAAATSRQGMGRSECWCTGRIAHCSTGTWTDQYRSGLESRCYSPLEHTTRLRAESVRELPERCTAALAPLPCNALLARPALPEALAACRIRAWSVRNRMPHQ